MLIGIIVVVGASRFTDSATFSDRVNADKVKFMLKTGQKAAMAQRRDVYVARSGSDVSLCYTNAAICPVNQMLILNQKAFLVNIGNTNLNLPVVKFNSIGSAGLTKITVQVGSKNIYIEPESGYIHE